MSYKTALIAKLKDSELWPTHIRPSFLNELNDVADKAFAKGSIEGYLASILIYHQLSEEMIKLLLKCCDFLIQIAIFPYEKELTHDDRRMFGQLLNDLEKTVSFKKKSEFIAKCKELNDIRIKMVHKLTRKSSLADIKIQSSQIKDIFDNIYELFEIIYDDFRVAFHSYQKDIEDDE